MTVLDDWWRILVSINNRRTFYFSHENGTFHVLMTIHRTNHFVKLFWFVHNNMKKIDILDVPLDNSEVTKHVSARVYHLDWVIVTWLIQGWPMTSEGRMTFWIVWAFRLICLRNWHVNVECCHVWLPEEPAIEWLITVKKDILKVKRRIY